MNTMKKVALVVALTAMASGAMAMTLSGENDNGSPIQYFEAIVDGGSCHVSFSGIPLILGQGESNKLPWFLVSSLCVLGHQTGDTCTATLHSYTAKDCSTDQGVIGTATLYMTNNISGHKIGDVTINSTYNFQVTNDPSDNSPTIELLAGTSQK